ncbi:hypothetical protein ASAP_2886 [Asaia bogorensis]|uniref:Uncharacterized protein n=1 Tax=Asaia bogorensis TaxID=91915 RepID=A0A060QLP1_9PROT|nr:hypothetical protein ASAP_2886 [Asaia bogorensis]
MEAQLTRPSIKAEQKRNSAILFPLVQYFTKIPDSIAG